MTSASELFECPRSTGAAPRQMGLDPRARDRLCDCGVCRAWQRGDGHGRQRPHRRRHDDRRGCRRDHQCVPVQGLGRIPVWVLLGALYIVAGFITFENPLFAAAILTLLLGASLVASGIDAIILAFSMKRDSHGYGCAVQHRHAVAGVVDPRALAGQQRLHPRHFPRHRPDHGRCRLGQLGLEPAAAPLAHQRL